MTRLVLPGFTARPARWLIHSAALVLRPLTIGVRALILDDRDQVFLVRHSYVPGWHFPGGGVEAGETARQAMEREVREEAGLKVQGVAHLHGLFFNDHGSRRDHIAVYIVRSFQVIEARVSDWEIVEGGFFPTKALPDGTAAAAHARLREVLDGVAPDEMW